MSSSLATAFRGEKLPALSQYVLRAEIAHGDRSTVYLGGREGEVGGEDFAVKVYDEGVLEELVPSLARTAMLTHRGLVPIRDAGTFDGRPALVLEYVRGVPLKQLLVRLGQRGITLPVATSVRAAAEIASALAQAHAQDARPLAHGRIQPAHLIVALGGSMKLIGLGGVLVKRSGTGDRPYLAPEVRRGGDPTPASDVFSLASVLYELLTGRTVWRAATSAVTSLAEPVPRPSRLNAAVDAALDELVLRALSTDPSDRPAHAKELAQVLEGWLSDSSLPEGRTLAGAVEDCFPEGPALKPLAEEKRTRPDAEAPARREPTTSDALTQIEDMPEGLAELTGSRRILAPVPTPVPEELEAAAAAAAAPAPTGDVPPPAETPGQPAEAEPAAPREKTIITGLLERLAKPLFTEHLPAIASEPTQVKHESQIVKRPELAPEKAEETVAAELASLPTPAAAPAIARPEPEPAALPEQGRDEDRELSGPIAFGPAGEERPVVSMTTLRRIKPPTVKILVIAGAGALAVGILLAVIFSGPSTGRLSIVSEPFGVTIALDGKEIGKTPTDAAELAPGEHVVIGSRDGYEPESMRVTVQAGATEHIKVTLKPVPPPPAPPAPVEAAAAPAAPEPKPAPAPSFTKPREPPAQSAAPAPKRVAKMAKKPARRATTSREKTSLKNMLGDARRAKWL